MGIVITKFRKKKTTYEVLEKLENEIKSIEEFRRNTEQTQKKMVGRFIFISICVYCITALILYFYFFPASAYERVIYIIPLVILPILLILIKRLLSWYYNRKIRKNQKKLTNLKDEKKKLLDEVMDKETYKVAKTILEKFAPEQIKKNNIGSSENTPDRRSLAPVSSVMQSQTGLRYRGALGGSLNQLNLGVSVTPKLPHSFAQSVTPARIQSQSVVRSERPELSSNLLPLPRAILPRERSVLDKMVDYLIGDGPSNRYALICKNCSSHNGMALKEEFEYLSFRCCYCSTFNPARKKRPAAPKLDTTLYIKSKKSDVSDSEMHSPSDTDSDSDIAAPIITEPINDSSESHTHLVEDKAPNLSDSDKLSDSEVKTTHAEISPVEDKSAPQTTENDNTSPKDEIESSKTDTN